jgi:hypothetical protein
MDKEVGGRSLRPIRHMELVVGRRTDGSEDYPLADTSLADGRLDLLKDISARVQAKDMEPSDTGGAKAIIVFSPGFAVFSSGGARPPTLTSDEQEGSRHNTQ